MPNHYLHDRPDFVDLLRILEQETGIDIQLVEKDYWIMHVLYGLKNQGFAFELKGGTSLSKGYKIIHRFSEDIDIHIQAPAHLNVNENPKSDKPKAVQSRRDFYDWLADEIKIDGIIDIQRDITFDDTDKYRSGGIRLFYQPQTEYLDGLKEGILLEAGFDTVTPNEKRLVSSWAYDKAAANSKISIHDNRAVDVACYHPGYTFVEKLQTVATKYRQEQESGEKKANLMRQYYDLYCLLDKPEVLAFIGTQAYFDHKKARSPKKDCDIPIAENEAFLLSAAAQRAGFEERYKAIAALYYNGQPEFEDLINRIQSHISGL